MILGFAWQVGLIVVALAALVLGGMAIKNGELQVFNFHYQDSQAKTVGGILIAIGVICVILVVVLGFGD